MRFMTFGRLDETKPDAYSPSAEVYQAVAALSEEMKQAGALVDTHGLAPSSQGARVAVQEGTHTVARGPFTDASGVISNFAILEAASLEEAIEWAARFADCVGQEIEVRQLTY
jgi:hypothetical protein